MAHEVMKRLLINLQTTNKVYERLLEVAERKQQHILHNEIERLREDIEHEEALAGSGADLNMEREQLHRQCQAQLNAGPQAGTLDELCRHMPEPWHMRFEEARTGLRQTLQELHNVNRVNTALVNNSIELMEGLLAALFDTEPAATYGPRGRRAVLELPARALNAKA